MNTSKMNPGLLIQLQGDDLGLITLLGVLHFGNTDMYPLPDSLLETFQVADTVAFETDLMALQQQNFNQMLATRSRLKNYKTRTDEIQSQLRQRLLKCAAELKVNPKDIVKMNPWYCAAVLTDKALRKTGLDSTLGVDAWLFNEATRLHKPLLCLETPEQQLDFLTQTDGEDPNAFLQQTLDEVDNMPHFAQNILDAWLQGDAQTLLELMEENFTDDTSLETRLLNNRNQTWASQLTQSANRDRRLFAVVGAGHLLGDSSLQSYLEQAGFHSMQVPALTA